MRLHVEFNDIVKFIIPESIDVINHDGVSAWRPFVAPRVYSNYIFNSA